METIIALVVQQIAIAGAYYAGYRMGKGEDITYENTVKPVVKVIRQTVQPVKAKVIHMAGPKTADEKKSEEIAGTVKGHLDRWWQTAKDRQFIKSE
jgi:hypothetical protein